MWHSQFQKASELLIDMNKIFLEKREGKMLAGELGELKSEHLKGAIYEKHFISVLVFRVIKVITAYLSSDFEKSL